MRELLPVIDRWRRKQARRPGYGRQLYGSAPVPLRSKMAIFRRRNDRIGERRLSSAVAQEALAILESDRPQTPALGIADELAQSS